MNKIAFVAASLSAFFLTSCDPRVFDDLADETWVDSAGKPGSLSSNNFGVGLVGAGGDNLHFVVGAGSPAAAVMMKFSENGTRTTVVTEVAETLASAGAITPDSVLASDPSGFASTEGNVAIGTFDGTNASIFMLRGENGLATTPFNVDGGAALTGIAFGSSDVDTPAGGCSAVDMVAVSGTSLTLAVDYECKSEGRDPDVTVDQSCSMGGTGSAALFADLSDTLNGQEIVVGVAGEVLVTNALTIETAIVGETGCFLAPADWSTDARLPTDDSFALAAPNAESSFGKILASGDLDGNGSADLVVGAPDEQKVFVYLNPKTESAVPEPIVIDAPAGSDSFASRVIVGDLNGDGNAEVVVADVGRDVDGVSGAGSVYLYELAINDFAEPVVLHDASPEKDQRFGQSIAISEAFGHGRLAVGAKNEVFTYFRTLLAGEVGFSNFSDE